MATLYYKERIEGGAFADEGVRRFLARSADLATDALVLNPEEEAALFHGLVRPKIKLRRTVKGMQHS